MGTGATIIGVASSAQYQAEHLMGTTVPFPLFLDYDRELYAALDIRSQSLLAFVFNLRAWMRYLRALMRNKRQYKITGHYSTLPAVAIILPDGSVPYLYKGSGIGDYPSVATVLEKIATTRA